MYTGYMYLYIVWRMARTSLQSWAIINDRRDTSGLDTCRRPYMQSTTGQHHVVILVRAPTTCSSCFLAAGSGEKLRPKIQQTGNFRSNRAIAVCMCEVPVRARAWQQWQRIASSRSEASRAYLSGLPISPCTALIRIALFAAGLCDASCNTQPTC